MLDDEALLERAPWKDERLKKERMVGASTRARKKNESATEKAKKMKWDPATREKGDLAMNRKKIQEGHYTHYKTVVLFFP